MRHTSRFAHPTAQAFRARKRDEWRKMLAVSVEWCADAWPLRRAPLRRLLRVLVRAPTVHCPRRPNLSAKVFERIKARAAKAEPEEQLTLEARFLGSAVLMKRPGPAVAASRPESWRECDGSRAPRLCRGSRARSARRTRRSAGTRSSSRSFSPRPTRSGRPSRARAARTFRRRSSTTSRCGSAASTRSPRRRRRRKARSGVFPGS